MYRAAFIKNQTVLTRKRVFTQNDSLISATGIPQTIRATEGAVASRGTHSQRQIGWLSVWLCLHTFDDIYVLGPFTYKGDQETDCAPLKTSFGLGTSPPGFGTSCTWRSPHSSEQTWRLMLWARAIGPSSPSLLPACASSSCVGRVHSRAKS